MSAALLSDPVLQAALHVGLAGCFARAAWHKLRDPGGFRDAVAAYGLLSRRPAALLALTLPAVEAALALGLLRPAWQGPACAAGAALLAVYGAAMAANLWRGRRDLPCGCGPVGSQRPVSWLLVARNGLLVGALALAAGPAGHRPWTWLDAVTVLAGIAAAWLAWAAALALADAAARPGRRPSP